ncbi:MAG TPA: hypothetical protein VGO76_19825, partial [Luteibacter sp.]|nr:hypothetical protein [Luteibacter sp.]
MTTREIPVDTVRAGILAGKRGKAGTAHHTATNGPAPHGENPAYGHWILAFAGMTKTHLSVIPVKAHCCPEKKSMTIKSKTVIGQARPQRTREQ